MSRLLPATLALALFAACNPVPDEALLDRTRGGRVEIFFNMPGTNPRNQWNPDAERVMVELVRGARSRIDIAVMGFSRQSLVDALIEAWDRGVELRFVGDAGHLENMGYGAFRDRHIPMSSGNLTHIMHDKFLVVDDRFVVVATSNFSTSDMRQNSNNFIFMDSPPIAADFTTEFEQMFEGRFGNMKEEVPNPRAYQIGDTEVEVWFSPNEDAIGRMNEYVDAARDSLRFTIFAFTKDQIGSSYVAKQAQFAAWNQADPGNQSPDGRFPERTVAGVIDQSQLHSNGQYHEAYRLLSAGIPIRLDGNDNSVQPGDYQAGGGRLHSKTMVIDAYGDEPVVLTGSFNWSSSAALSNDEYLIVMKSPRIAEQYDQYFLSLWDDGRRAGGDRVSEDEVAPGEIVINEVMWYGVNSGSPEGTDEFIELRNLTDKRIDLSLWSITNANDVVMGFPPGSVLPANGTFTVLDHTLESYVDGAPQDGVSAFHNGDMVLNAFNDDRQARLYLKDGTLLLQLRDPEGVLIDTAGDGGAAFAGGPGTDGKARSMERNANAGDGSLPSSWHPCGLSEGGANVNPGFRGEVVATPGETNSPG